MEAKLTGSILHDKTCPICDQDWTGLQNDLERLAHLLICAITARPVAYKENGGQR
jgi:hypothetical protein